MPGNCRQRMTKRVSDRRFRKNGTLRQLAQYPVAYR
jgi:hypothetical protein